MTTWSATPAATTCSCGAGTTSPWAREATTSSSARAGATSWPGARRPTWCGAGSATIRSTLPTEPPATPWTARAATTPARSIPVTTSNTARRSRTGGRTRVRSAGRSSASASSSGSRNRLPRVRTQAVCRLTRPFVVSGQLAAAGSGTATNGETRGVMIWIGTSGWQYRDWRGTFYPERLPQRRWLEFFSRRFPTVEVNNSFYMLPKESSFERWRDETPPGFVVTVKASRYITHIRRLRDAGESLELFWSRAKLLGDKLGPVLFQLPPKFRADVGLLEGFLALLPREIRAA